MASNLPPLPAAPKKDLPRQFQTGDAVVRPDSVVGRAGGAGSPGRNVTMADAKQMLGPKERRIAADGVAAAGGRKYKRLVGGSRSAGGKR